MVYGGEIVYLMVLYQSKRSARRSQDEWCGLWHIGTHLFREYNHQWFSFPLSVDWYKQMYNVRRTLMMNEKIKMRYVSCPSCGKQLLKVAGN